MSFKIHSIDDNRISGIEYLPCGAITPKVGMALVQSGGNLALATGTNAPTYISMCEKDSPCTAGDIIPVIRVPRNDGRNGKHDAGSKGAAGAVHHAADAEPA